MVASIGAGVLFISLFLNWYKPGMTAWATFEVWDLVLAALAVGGLLAAAAELGWWRGPLLGVPVLTMGVCALAIVAVQLLNHPPAAVGHELDPGAWLGLVGALAMTLGAALAEGRVPVGMGVEPPAVGRWRSGAGRAAPPPPPPRGPSTEPLPDGAPAAGGVADPRAMRARAMQRRSQQPPPSQ